MTIKWLDKPNSHPAPYMTLCLNEKQFKEALARIKITTPIDFVGRGSNATTHIFTLDGKVTCIVCLRPAKHHTLNQIYAVLVHECVHIWQELREMIGEKNPSSEFEAYTIQWICQQFFYAYTDAKRGRRRKG